LSIAGLLVSCATTRLEDYQPNSEREKEVLEVFNKMVTARENEDFEAYMAFFHDDAKIFKRLHPGSNNGSFLPKQQYAASPGEEFGIQPMLSNIQITFGEDIAILKCWNQYREVRSHWTLDMEKENGEWRVIKYDYTPYRRY
jgi:ketosteroid isomerase-like protein